MSERPTESMKWKAAGLRWLLPLWLLAAFAGAQFALASSSDGNRAALVESWLVESWSSNLPIYKGEPAAEIIERHRPAFPDAIPLVGDGVDDGVQAAILHGEAAPAPRLGGPSRFWHVDSQTAAFNSRAPPFPS